ncbi:MAG: MarR family transcriptional regulator [Marmoricola sp.]|jgi:DNA-binding MarR family transcriptional regulator|nr:MarR family transcriptional regulator [Marmoricola sp.]
MGRTSKSVIENPLALQEQVCFALAVASRSVVAIYRPLLEPMGLTHPKYLVMLALWEHEPVKVKDLSGMLQLDSATLSPLLKKLESMGLIRRERDPNDERSLAIVLTRKGHDLRAEAEKIPPAIVARLGLPLDDLIAMREVLKRVITATQ